MPDLRRQPARHVLSEAIFRAIIGRLESQGFKLSKGTIIEAAIIEAPSSTKNKEPARDPDMRSITNDADGASA